jgi:hypothetical protein
MFGAWDVAGSSTTEGTTKQRAANYMQQWERLEFMDGIALPEVGAELGLTPPDILKQWPLKSLYEYWAKHGAVRYKVMADVAKSVFAVEGAAARIERDFCIAGKTVTSDRSSMDPAWVDMLITSRDYIGGKEVVIPDDLSPHLTVCKPEDLRDIIPRLCVSEEGGDEGDDLDSDVEQDEGDATRMFSRVGEEEEKEAEEEEEEEEEEAIGPLSVLGKRPREDGGAGGNIIRLRLNPNRA